MNSPLESIWKGTVVTRFTTLSRNLLGGTEESLAKHKDIRCPRRDLNPASPEYKSETVLLKLA